MQSPVAALVAALDLAGGAGDRFTGHSPAGGSARVFGGLILAQALVAAARTSAGRPAHALHASFLRPGDPGEPFDYEVERLLDGRSFTARRCTARQHGRPVFTLAASFHAPEANGLDHAAAMPEVPAPDAPPSPSAPPLPPALRAFLARHPAVELRPVGLRGPGPATAASWLRIGGALPDDPVLHAALLAYLSDIPLLDTALRRHGRSVFEGNVQAASLDHAVWFHRPARADGWLLCAADSPSACGGRGLARAALFDRAGRHAASTAQEGLMRLRAGDRERSVPILPAK